MHRYVTALLFGAGLAAVVTSAQAGEALPRDMSNRLDHAPIEFTMSEAKRERLMIIQENMARQRQYGRGGYGYGRGDGGYGYGRSGYGPGYGRGGYGPGYGPRYGGGVRVNPDPSIFDCGGAPCRRRW